jgi:hypothetical protein
VKPLDNAVAAMMASGVFLPLLVFQARPPSFGVFHQRHLRKQSNDYILFVTIFAFVGVPSSPAVVWCFPPTTLAKAIERIYFICNYLIIRHKLILPIVGGKHQQRQKLRNAFASWGSLSPK